MYLVCLPQIKNNSKRNIIKYLSYEDQKTWRLDNSRLEISTEISLEAVGSVTVTLREGTSTWECIEDYCY